MRYICDPHIVPTVVPLSLADLTAYALASARYATALHIDVADGSFAQNTTWPLAYVEQLQEFEQLGRSAGIPPTFTMEAHLMVDDPREVGTRFARAGVAVTAHIESFIDQTVIAATLRGWKDIGAPAAGLAILLDTPLEALDPHISACSYVQVLSVAQIGAQGQPFDDRALHRVEELHAKYPDLLVVVDGGITEANIEELVRAGANRLCVGSAISRAENPALAFAKIHERAMRGCAPQRSTVAV